VQGGSADGSLETVPGVVAPLTPNFFLVGAPKAGTTSLYHYLGQHPDVYISPKKEPNYFANEFRFENFTEDFQRMDLPNPGSGPVSEWPEYLTLFQGANGQAALGEASVCYLWSKTAPGNIAANVPDARIIIVLRDPVERAFSQYLHMLTYANSPTSFHEHVEAAIGSKSTRIGKLYPFLEFGLYYEQVKRYFARFPRERVGIYFYEDYVRSPMAMVQDIFRFLSVNPAFQPDLSLRHTVPLVPRSYPIIRFLKQLGWWERAKSLSPPAVRRQLRRIAFRPRTALVVEPVDRARLLEYYRQDIRNLASLLNRDLSAWLR
jgi:hypothetical protein